MEVNTSRGGVCVREWSTRVCMMGEAPRRLEFPLGLVLAI